MVATTTDQPKPHTKKRLVLPNVTCIYCGQILVAESNTEEHVIGKRFVPKGMLAARWNLIARCCQPCNGRKAALENDISAILLQPSAFGVFASDKALLATEATRKGTSRHPNTGKTVKDSTTSLTVPAAMTPSVQMSIGFVGPPMVDHDRAAQLAWHHVTAFLYASTFDQATQSGRFARGVFMVFDQSLRTDWGNVVQRAFAKEVLPWKMVLGLRAADGYFKATIRKHSSFPCHSWALEWNMNMRIVGFLGDEEVVESFAQKMPEFNTRVLPTAPGERLCFREERTLEESDDHLFSWGD